MGRQRIVVASDHAGFKLKQAMVEHLRGLGFEVLDAGPENEASVDYPDFAHKASREIEEGNAEMGILTCGSGNGVNMAANKHHGIRSALAWEPEIARLARAHNDANMLALPARFLTEAQAISIVDAFIEAPFEGGRHERRVTKIEESAVRPTEGR